MEPITPANDRTLGFAAFAALWWVVVNQFRDHLDLHLGARFGLVAKGYLGADLFLILIAFVLTGIWQARDRTQRGGHDALVWRRIIPNYPAHLLAIAAMAGLLLVGKESGAGFDTSTFKLGALPANLLLVHAWGVLPTVYWNFPSWMFSTEFLGLLLFPVFAWLGAGLARPIVMIAVALVLFETMFQIAALRGVLFTDMTAQIGALRIFPDFLFGAALYGLAQKLTPPRNLSIALAAISTVWIFAAAALRLTDMVIWPVFGLLVFSLAQAGQNDGPALDWPPLRYLARIAYSTYLVYLPVDIAYFHAWRRLLGEPTGASSWIAIAGVFPVILLAGAVAYHLVEKPIGGWLSRHPPFRRPAPSPASA